MAMKGPVSGTSLHKDPGPFIRFRLWAGLGGRYMKSGFSSAARRGPCPIWGTDSFVGKQSTCSKCPCSTPLKFHRLRDCPGTMAESGKPASSGRWGQEPRTSSGTTPFSKLFANTTACLCLQCPGHMPECCWQQPTCATREGTGVGAGILRTWRISTGQQKPESHGLLQTRSLSGGAHGWEGANP